MMTVTFFLNIDKGRTFWIVLAILNMIWISNNLLCRLKKNEDIACEVLMEIFKEKYGDKIFLIDKINEAKKNGEEILLSNGVILDFSDYTISRIE